MKIAVPYENGNIFPHFGRTVQFKLYEVENGQVTATRVLGTHGQGHGALAGLLEQTGVDVLICGGIGGGAQAALSTVGIRLYGGVSGRPTRRSRTCWRAPWPMTPPSIATITARSTASTTATARKSTAAPATAAAAADPLSSPGCKEEAMSNITKKALEASLKKMMLKKPLAKITIRDITDDCGISRMTFY